ncbi:MAG: ribosome biogenesis GTP-binding protein YihA/YsxC [Deltaproteobacteria bacterium]|jgi:GTP-binding protein|nr:ribosome biogenesis GTP-binding protein YihA/YsxC [Deltaproteobacteria bacterium]
MAYNAFKTAGATGAARQAVKGVPTPPPAPLAAAPQSPPAVSVDFVLGAASEEQFPEPLGWEAAFMGRSNSGKSSMLNRLLGRKAMARVSAAPGRTREINFFKVLWRKGGEPFYVADFPGYGFARAPKDKVRGWGRLAGAYLSGGRGQKSFLLVDVRRRLSEDEFMLLDLFRELNTPAVLVATKCDKISKAERARRLEEWRKSVPGDVPLLAFSALTGEGREELILEAMPSGTAPDVRDAEATGARAVEAAIARDAEVSDVRSALAPEAEAGPYGRTGATGDGSRDFSAGEGSSEDAGESGGVCGAEGDSGSGGDSGSRGDSGSGGEHGSGGEMGTVSGGAEGVLGEASENAPVVASEEASCAMGAPVEEPSGLPVPEPVPELGSGGEHPGKAPES